MRMTFFQDYKILKHVIQVHTTAIKSGITQIEAMQADIDVMKNVIREHSEKLKKIS